MPIRAFAFDLDETLVDAEVWHEEATRAMLAAALVAPPRPGVPAIELPAPLREGAPQGEDAAAELRRIAHDVWTDITGKRTRDIVEAFRVAAKLPHELDHLLEVRTRAFRDACERAPPAMMPGARELLDACHARGPVALVTSGHVGDALATVETLGIHDRFSAIVTGEDVERPKPHPEPYLTAARHLGVDPRAMLAFEDSARGVRAAKAAGMRVVAVPNVRNTKRALVHDADLVLDSMVSALPLDSLLARLR